MKILVDSVITIINPSKEIKDYCKEFLTFKNPEIQRKQAMGFWTGNLKPTIYLYSKRDDSYILPIGCLDDIWKINPNLEDYTVNFGKHKKIEFPKLSFEPYPYQEKAINAMIKAKRGILKANCGSGKSICAINIIQRLGYKAIIIVQTMEILNQFKEYCLNVMGLKTNEIGIIAAGKVEIGEKITLALRQTLCKIDLLNYKYEWGTIIVDECVSGDTEILTEKGFVRFDELEKDIKVAQFNNDKTVEFVNPLRYIEKECESYISFKNKNTELLFSENHDIVYEKKENVFCKRKAYEYLEDSFSEDIVVNSGIVKNTSNQKLSVLDKIGIMLQADGCVYHKNKKETVWKLEFSKEKKIAEFKKLCKEANITYKEYKIRKFKSSKWNNSYKFTIKLPHKNYKILTNFLEIPQNIQYANEIIQEISKWDSYWTKNNILEYDCTIYENIKFLATVAFLANIKCSKIITIHRKNKKHKTIYRLYLYKKQKTKYDKFKKERVNQKKKMYCVEVPSNMIVCKKDDFIFVTGNCQNVSSNPSCITQYEKILNNLAAEYRISLSATPRRNDGLTNSMFALCGKIKHEITSEEVADKTIKAQIQPIYTDYKMPYVCQKSDGTLDYVKMPTALATNKDRNTIILELLKQNKENYCLILSDRLEGLKLLQEELGEGMMIDGSMTSKKAKQQREESIQKMRDKKEHFLFASFSLARERIRYKTTK